MTRISSSAAALAIASAGVTVLTGLSTVQPALAQDATPLPEIVVTSPSPVVKKHKKAPAAAKAASKKTPATPGEPEPLPAPASSHIDAAAGTPIVADDAFVPITVVTERDIQAQPGATLTDSLQNRPGITGSNFAPGANRPVIRGLDNYRVRVQENGIGTHDVSALSEDHAIPVDPFAAERIEVVRGPATLRYGSQAIGGVVSVENDRIPSFIPPRGYTAEFMGGLNSVDDGRDGAFKVTSGAGPVAFHADGFARRSDDYDTPDGRQRNSFVESQGGAVGGSLVGPRGFVGVSLARIESLYGIPGGDVSADPRIDMAQDKINAKGEWHVHNSGIEALRFWFGASDYAHNELATEDGEEFIGSRFTNKEQEGRLELQHMPVATSLGELSGAVGVQWGHRNIRGQSFEGESLLEPAETDSIAGFIFEELQLNQKLRLQAAARIEHNRVTGIGIEDPLGPAPVPTAQDRSFDPFGTSLGLLYELPMNTVARLTGQYVERAPDAAELFSKGVHEATGTFEIGNPDLAVEKASTVEIGLKRATGSFRFDASAYYTQYDDFIFKQLTGVFCGDTSCGPAEDELKQLVFGQRDATFYGAELAAQYDVARVWHGLWGIDGQYDFVRAEFDNGENVPRIPPHRLGGGLFYRDANWFARVGVLHAFDQDEIGLNETETKGYTLLSAEVSYTTRLEPNALGAPQLTVGLKGENLADDEVRNHVSFKKDEVLEPGASVRLFGSVKLN